MIIVGNKYLSNQNGVVEKMNQQQHSADSKKIGKFTILKERPDYYTEFERAGLLVYVNEAEKQEYDEWYSNPANAIQYERETDILNK